MFGTQIAHIRRNFPDFDSVERSWICYFNRLLAATLRVHLLAPAGFTRLCCHTPSCHTIFRAYNIIAICSHTPNICHSTATLND